MDFLDHPTALAFLNSLANDPENLIQLREAISQFRANLGMFSRDDSAVLDQIAWALVRGELKVVIKEQSRFPVIPWEEAQVGGGEFEEEYTEVTAEDEETTVEPIPGNDPVEWELPTVPDQVAQAAALVSAAETGKPFCEECEKARQALEEKKDTAWVEVRVVDDQDQPVAYERYRLKLPDGSVREGELDSAGRVRVEDIDPGTCQFQLFDKDIERTGYSTDHWVEVLVVDENDQPVSDEPYRLVLTDGSIREGVLGPDGRVRVDGIPEGTCRFSLPDRHNNYSEPVTAETAWVDIQCVDENDQPVSGEPYQLVLPDGRTQEGTLDEEGRVRVENIRAGNCQFTLTERRGVDWEPIND